MNPVTKFSVYLCGVLALLALSACAYPGTGTNPTRIVNKTAALIADFTPPPAYTPEYGLHALGYTAVAYHNDDNGHLYLVQSEADADGAALQAALDEMVPGYRDAERDLEVIEQRTLTIRNQDVTVAISEGTDWEEERMRQATAVFQGKAGPTLLILREPIAQWDDAAFETFLASVR